MHENHFPSRLKNLIYIYIYITSINIKSWNIISDSNFFPFLKIFVPRINRINGINMENSIQFTIPTSTGAFDYSFHHKITWKWKHKLVHSSIRGNSVALYLPVFPFMRKTRQWLYVDKYRIIVLRIIFSKFEENYSNKNRVYWDVYFRFSNGQCFLLYARIYLINN